jgi:hypothetical protein
MKYSTWYNVTNIREITIYTFPREISVQTAHFFGFTVFMPFDPKACECLLTIRYIFHRSSNQNQAFISNSGNGVVDLNKQC